MMIERGGEEERRLLGFPQLMCNVLNELYTIEGQRPIHIAIDMSRVWSPKGEHTPYYA